MSKAAVRSRNISEEKDQKGTHSYLAGGNTGINYDRQFQRNMFLGHNPSSQYLPAEFSSKRVKAVAAVDRQVFGQGLTHSLPLRSHCSSH